ncbi:MAG: nucleotidyltransferase family protein [Phycisphaerae bacterium]
MMADIPSEEIKTFCRQHHIRKLSLFGSAVRDDFTSDSDVDVLVEFEPGRTPGLGFFTIQAELSDLLGRPVDLNTAEDLSPYYREDVLREAKVLYDAA